MAAGRSRRTPEECYQDLSRHAKITNGRVLSSGILNLFFEHPLNAIFRLLREEHFVKRILQHSVLLVQTRRDGRGLHEDETNKRSLT